MITGSNRSRRRLRRAAAGMAVAALLMSACGADEGQSAASDDQASEAATGTAEAAVLPTVSGGQIDINSLEGTDTILWYWAPW